MGTGGGAPQRGLGLGCSTPGWGEQRTRASWSGVRTGFGAHRMENGYVHHWGRGEEQRNTEGGDGLHRWRRAGGGRGGFRGRPRRVQGNPRVHHRRRDELEGGIASITDGKGEFEGGAHRGTRGGAPPRTPERMRTVRVHLNKCGTRHRGRG